MLKYFYIDDVSKQQYGPFSPNELLRKNIHPDTMIWRSGMADWQEAGTMPELNYLFDSTVSAPQAAKQEVRQQQSIPSAQLQPENNCYTQNETKNKQTLDEVIPMPKNWLVESVCFSLFCCSPVSLIGLYYAINVETLYRNNDYDRALEASRKARLWTLLGLLFLPAVFLLLICI